MNVHFSNKRNSLPIDKKDLAHILCGSAEVLYSKVKGEFGALTSLDCASTLEEAVQTPPQVVRSEGTSRDPTGSVSASEQHNPLNDFDFEFDFGEPKPSLVDQTTHAVAKFEGLYIEDESGPLDPLKATADTSTANAKNDKCKGVAAAPSSTQSSVFDVFGRKEDVPDRITKLAIDSSRPLLKVLSDTLSALLADGEALKGEPVIRRRPEGNGKGARDDDDWKGYETDAGWTVVGSESRSVLFLLMSKLPPPSDQASVGVRSRRSSLSSKSSVLGRIFGRSKRRPSDARTVRSLPSRSNTGGSDSSRKKKGEDPLTQMFLK